MTWRKGLHLIAVGVLALCANEARSMDLGEFEYRNSCAQCHGLDGTGDGPVTPYLHMLPPNLTVLRANNGGVFPVTEVYAIIEGTADVAVHGGRDMPLWGDRYRERAAQIGDETADFPFDPATDSDRYAKARILAIVEYLSTLQVE